MKVDFPFNKDLELIFNLLGYNCRLVGGCVRDYILYGTLVEDIDIATPILPDHVIALLQDRFTIIPTGLSHGTITIIGEKKYEITTLRKDDYTDGRHAIVSFNDSYETDASRRDFSMNALYCDYDGNIYDYFNGLEDLQDGLVRFIGEPEQRIAEDFLRILRFFRFSTRFGSMDLLGKQACYNMAFGLQQISKERVTQEWFRILSGAFFFDFYNDFKPIMETIGLQPKHLLEDYKQLSSLGFTSLFFNESSRLCLSNIQKKYINLLKSTVLNSQADANLLYNKLGDAFLSDKMIIDGKVFDKISIPSLPVSGQELVEKGYHGKVVGEILRDLEYTWYEKFGNISKDELLKTVECNGKYI